MENRPPEKRGFFDRAKEKSLSLKKRYIDENDDVQDALTEGRQYVKEVGQEYQGVKKSAGEVKVAFGQVKQAWQEREERRRAEAHNKAVDRLAKLTEQNKEKRFLQQVRNVEAENRRLDEEDRQYRRGQNPILRMVGGFAKGSRAVMGGFQDTFGHGPQARPHGRTQGQYAQPPRPQFAGSQPSISFAGDPNRLLEQLRPGSGNQPQRAAPQRNQFAGQLQMGKSKKFDFTVGHSKFQKGKVPKFI